MDQVKIHIPKCADDARVPRILWFVGLSAIWMLWVLQKANEVRAAKAAEVATYLVQWGHGGDAGRMYSGVIFFGVMALYLVFLLAHVIAIIQVAIQKIVARIKQHGQDKRDQLAFNDKMQDMQRDSEKQAELSKAAKSKQELIMRLGSIDQYIRVLAIETDASKRTVALQAAHSEMTTLAAKLASDQISREFVESPDIRAQASETSNDLARLGLSEDRLNRDIIRMFKLSAG